MSINECDLQLHAHFTNTNNIAGVGVTTNVCKKPSHSTATTTNKVPLDVDNTNQPSLLSQPEELAKVNPPFKRNQWNDPQVIVTTRVECLFSLFCDSNLY